MKAELIFGLEVESFGLGVQSFWLKVQSRGFDSPNHEFGR